MNNNQKKPTQKASATAQSGAPRRSASGSSTPQRAPKSASAPVKSAASVNNRAAAPRKAEGAAPKASSAKKVGSPSAMGLISGLFSSRSKKKVDRRKASRSFTPAHIPAERRYGADNTALVSLLKAIIYIICILIVSGFLSCTVIMVGNDVFAFVKDDHEVKITIEGGESVAELGEILKNNGIINYAKIFDLYAAVKGKNPEFVAGEYTVSPSMGYDELMLVFAKKTAVTRTTVIVTIPEGYTIDQIIDLLVNKYKLSSKDDLIDAIQNYEFDFWFLNDLKVTEQRKYRLEGYLYPDTYYYYSDASAPNILYKMLANFDKKMKDIFGKEYIEKIDGLCKKHGMTFDEIVTLASMVQMESKYDQEFGTISSVFHNRLDNPSVTNGKLESDATIQYALGRRKTELSYEDLRIDSPYNTYTNNGLPPGPISNPDYLAINYALYPDSTRYYFFVAGNDGYTIFAKTKKEHDKNIADINAEREEQDR